MSFTMCKTAKYHQRRKGTVDMPEQRNLQHRKCSSFHQMDLSLEFCNIVITLLSLISTIYNVAPTLLLHREMVST